MDVKKRNSVVFYAMKWLIVMQCGPGYNQPKFRYTSKYINNESETEFTRRRF